MDCIVIDHMFKGRLFPYEAMFRWLSYGNDPSSENEFVEKDFFSHREWSFTIEDDIYIRYQSFFDKNEMMAMIQKRQPHKIDIGAVFTACPKDHTTIKPELFTTVERELVFDIDMTDYDDIRTCCTGAEICGRCWPYMTMAVKVVDTALREDFDFKHILWVYSGRRGVHCWVCDPIARNLTNEARTAVVDYLSVHTGSADNSDKKLKQNFTQPHPMMARAYDILDPLFERWIADEKGQGLLARKDRYMKVLNSLPNEIIRKELYDDWERNDGRMSGAERWRQVREKTTSPSPDNTAALTAARKKRINFAELDAWRIELVFTHCYPRLDTNVSKTQNHLLKSPFCVHPKTGRVCVPIDASRAERFDPFTVPTVRSLCEEVDSYDASQGSNAAMDGEEGVSDLQKTALKDAVDLFNRGFLRELYETIRREFREKADQNAAMNMDF